MKNLPLTTKAKLIDFLITESLFSAGGTLSKSELQELFNNHIKYATGKISPAMKGEIFKDISIDYKPVWYISGSDSYGKYINLITVHNYNLTDKQKETLAKVQRVIKIHSER